MLLIRSPRDWRDFQFRSPPGAGPQPQPPYGSPCCPLASLSSHDSIHGLASRLAGFSVLLASRRGAPAPTALPLPPPPPPTPRPARPPIASPPPPGAPGRGRRDTRPPRP